MLHRSLLYTLYISSMNCQRCTYYKMLINYYYTQPWLPYHDLTHLCTPMAKRYNYITMSYLHLTVTYSTFPLFITNDSMKCKQF